MVLLDMKMPNGCGDCNLRDFGDGHCDVYCCPEQFKINEEDKTRPEYCPIKREIVMCKDCKYWEQYSDVPKIGNCPVLDRSERDNWFCANGKRKDGDGE